jgi:hypothetical protein
MRQGGFMAEQYEYLAALAEEAEKLLMTNTVFRKKPKNRRSVEA